MDEKYFGGLARDSTETLPLSTCESSTTAAFKALDDIHQMEEMTTDESRRVSVVSDEMRSQSKILRSTGSFNRGIKDGESSIMRVKSEVNPTMLYERHQGQRESVRYILKYCLQAFFCGSADVYVAYIGNHF